LNDDLWVGSAANSGIPSHN